MRHMRLALLLFAAFGLASAQGQTVTVSGSHLGGPNAVTGVISFQPTLCDVANTPASATLSGGAGITSRQPHAGPVTAGAFSLTGLVDSSSSIPQNLGYNVTVRTSAGLQALGPGFSCVQPAANNSWCSGGVCNFDNYKAAVAPLVPQTQGPVGPQGAPGINGQVMYADLATVIPTAGVTYGVCNAATGSGYNDVYAHTIGGAVTVPGVLSSFQVDVASYTSGAVVTVLVLNQTTSGSFQQTQRFTVPIKATGVNTFTSGTDYSGVGVSAGQFFGILSDHSWYFTNNASAPLGYVFAGDPGTASVAYSADNNNRNVAFTVQALQPVASQAFASAAATTAANSAVSLIDPPATTTLDFFDSGTSSGNSGSTFRTIVQGQASPVSGTITTVNAAFSSVASGGGTVVYFVANKTAANTFQITNRASLSVPAAGTTALNPNLSIAAGQYAGYIVNGSASMAFGSGVSSIGSFYLSSDPGTAATAYSTGGPASVAFVVTYYPAITPQYISPLAGTRFGVWGHSLTTPGYEYTAVNGTTYTYWQQYFAALTGQTWVFNDGCVGGGYYNAFHHYPGLSLSNLTAPYVSDNCFGQNGNLPNTTEPIGKTLAQNLANVDTLYVWYGDNDIGKKAVGSPGDAVAANTNYGDIDNDLAILFMVKPSLHVVLIDTPQANNAGVAGYAGYVTQKTFEQTAGQQYGAPLIDALSLFGLNPETWTTWQNTDSGQYLHPTNIGWAHFVPILARAATIK